MLKPHKNKRLKLKIIRCDVITIVFPIQTKLNTLQRKKAKNKVEYVEHVDFIIAFIGMSYDVLDSTVKFMFLCDQTKSYNHSMKFISTDDNVLVPFQAHQSISCWFVLDTISFILMKQCTFINE